MNKPRTSADDKKNQTSAFKSLTGYGSNLLKETKQFGSAYKKTTQKSNESGPGTDAEASRLRKIEDNEFGQMLGALIQGRRYNKKGKQIK